MTFNKMPDYFLTGPPGSGRLSPSRTLRLHRKPHYGSHLTHCTRPFYAGEDVWYMNYDAHKRGMDILIQHTFTILSSNGRRSVLVNNSEQTDCLRRGATVEARVTKGNARDPSSISRAFVTTASDLFPQSLWWGSVSRYIYTVRTT